MDIKASKISRKIRDMCFIAIFSAVIAVCAQIVVPMPGGVPFTLQTFAILLAGIILGAKKGATSVLIYILLGAAGVPVFQSFTGGLGVILNYTGGYILSFPVMAFCAGAGADLQAKFKNIWLKNIVLAAGLVFGAAINFICGMFWGKYILNLSLQAAFAGFVAPFILTSAIQIILAGIFGVSVRKLFINYFAGSGTAQI
jgi:biotin transport system substrate-specific component